MALRWQPKAPFGLVLFIAQNHTFRVSSYLSVDLYSVFLIFTSYVNYELSLQDHFADSY